jgi:predicted transcriptional regulator
MNRRRSNIQIIRDMLRIGENGAGKTKLMYNANMSYAQIQKYLKFLISQGLIDKVHVGNPSVTYQITGKGQSLIKSIDAVLEILEMDDTGL